MSAEFESMLLRNSRETAKVLGISERKLWSLTSPRGPIPCVRMGRNVRYDLADVRAYVNAAKSISDDKCNPTREGEIRGESVNK
ncbi:helix-turn-helix domain-containing protein [Rubinisphaera margarita]|uniref:helix-turn-helix domain-containing protein n=1 Tax=Rubinisphaera margarita TaxID=2909586 RepID=UPI001EE7EE87|nr:helix-turn-helix domain-containing protein [Rubinisphaera margarita]MCG6158313.1 helix-turn-helix domain-containing protein [Rubinisphaera margarita]